MLRGLLSYDGTAKMIDRKLIILILLEIISPVILLFSFFHFGEKDGFS